MSGAVALAAPRVTAVRRALLSTPAGPEIARIGLKEANEACTRLGIRLGAVHDHVVSVALRRGDVIGCITVCSRPTQPLLDDALTLEVRILARAISRAEYHDLLLAVERVASSLGYRRLLTSASALEGAGRQLEPLGWSRWWGGADDRQRWVKVLRGDRRVG